MSRYQGYSRHCPETEHHSWLRTGTLDTSQLEQIMSTAEWYKWFRSQSCRERQAWKARERERAVWKGDTTRVAAQAHGPDTLHERHRSPCYHDIWRYRTSGLGDQPGICSSSLLHSLPFMENWISCKNIEVTGPSCQSLCAWLLASTLSLVLCLESNKSKKNLQKWGILHRTLTTRVDGWTSEHLPPTPHSISYHLAEQTAGL